MISGFSVPLRWLTTLAQNQGDSQVYQVIELDLPESTTGILISVIGLAALFAVTCRTSLRDSRFLAAPWRVLLLSLRVAVLLLLIVILVNPSRRTQLSRIDTSRVAVLIDTSLSMALPAADDPATGPPPDAADRQTRAEAVFERLVGGELLTDLSRTHTVSVHTFGSDLDGPVAVVSDGRSRLVEERRSDGDSASVPGSPSASDDSDTTGDAATEDDWRRLMEPRASETQLGQSLHQLIGQVSGRTLSGIVVVSDGQSNAGLDPENARLRAEKSGVRIVTLGVGNQRPQVNLRVAGMQSPADVHKGDPFDVRVFVSGTGTLDTPVSVRLFQRSAGGDSDDEREVADETLTLSDDGIPTTVTFTQTLPVPGRYEYIARVSAVEPLREITVDDNERRREIEATDRQLKVLIISSGPMRDYQFVRNTLYRHSGVDSDVWLQTVTEDNVGFVSQEATKLLTEFPATEAALFEYDVIVGFDPDWSRLSDEQAAWLNRWVADHSGGLIVVAGEIFTPRLARNPDEFRDIAVLYPVVLNRMLPELQVTQRADEPWPVLLTPEGRSSEFLKITDALGNTGTELWESFRGIYRSYPVRSVRDGAVVLLEYGNPRARTERGQPPFLATQFFGTGRTMFLGSAETWRLREISPAGHQSLWTSLIREAGQGRRSRGNARGILLLDQSEVSPGEPVQIRAQLYDARLQPLQTDSVPVTITDQAGRPVSVPDRLRSDGRGTGQYVATFRPPRAGSWRISLTVPESTDVLQARVEVVLPNLESENSSRNTALLKALTMNTEGDYLPLDEAADRLPDLLPDRSEPVIVDEQLRCLWDRRWLMMTLILLLSVEWGTRKLVRLS